MKRAPWCRIFGQFSSRPNSTNVAMATLESLNFDNLALRTLPLDSEKANFTREVKGACFSRVDPTPVNNPKLVAFSPTACSLLDLPHSECKRLEFAKYLSGNAILPGSEPAAHCYCGHQFGYFSGQLGDGATMYLGEVVNRKGERWELQLKGAGKTPYSRTADGRKVLRSSIREFLCSEAMHCLGIPTTRSGSCVTSDSYVTRDIFYTGNNIQERCTVISRIAPTFIRFGSFEIFKNTDEHTGRKGPSVGRTDILTKLVEYCIQTFYPNVWETFTDPEERVLQFFREVVRRTAVLVARWQCVGFCHGVLNTDNMSIVGVTIDYGPYGFMDRFDPEYICNSSDDGGRYTYSKQPEICKWNCSKLAQALRPVLSLERSTDALKEFDFEFEQEYSRLMHNKFGLQKHLPEDGKLFENFLDTMYETGADFTNSFRILSKFHSEADLEVVCGYLLDQCCSVKEYKAAFAPQMDPAQLQMLLMLQSSNPDLLAMLGKKAGALQRELTLARRADELRALTADKKKEKDSKFWKIWLKNYAERLNLELPDTVLEEFKTKRLAVMDSANPRIVLRNFILQNAIEDAESGDFSEVKKILQKFQNPFDGSLQNSNMAAFDANSSTAEENFTQIQSGPSTSAPVKCTIQYDARPPDATSIRVS